MSGGARWWLGRALGRLLGGALSALPDHALSSLARLLGGALWWLLPRRRQLACGHAQLALPHTPAEERRRVARAGWTHVCLTALVGLRRAAGVRGEPVAREEDVARLRALLGEGRGLLVVSGHLGDFEGLLALHLLLGRPVWLLSRRFSSQVAQGLWDASRAAAPPRLDRGARARWVVERLRAGEVVVDVIDQHDPRPSALWLPFFGVHASVSSDVGRLALLTGAPVVPVFCVRAPLPRGRGERLAATVVVGEAVRADPRFGRAAVEGVVAACVSALEEAVRGAPEQWLWVHRRWKPRPRRAPSAAPPKAPAPPTPPSSEEGA